MAQLSVGSEGRAAAQPQHGALGCQGKGYWVTFHVEFQRNYSICFFLLSPRSCVSVCVKREERDGDNKDIRKLSQEEGEY